QVAAEYGIDSPKGRAVEPFEHDIPIAGLSKPDDHTQRESDTGEEQFPGQTAHRKLDQLGQALRVSSQNAKAARRLRTARRCPERGETVQKQDCERNYRGGGED